MIIQKQVEKAKCIGKCLQGEKNESVQSVRLDTTTYQKVTQVWIRFKIETEVSFPLDYLQLLMWLDLKISRK